MTMLKKGTFLIYVFLLVLFGCGKKGHETGRESSPTKVTIKQVSISRNPEILDYSGNIEADNTVTIGFSVSGRVAKVYVNEGEQVSKGQLLAILDAETYENNLLIASANLEQAQDNFNRLELLYNKKSLPERDYISAKVALAQARANREVAAKNVRDTKLYAPSSGIVTGKLTEAGASAAPGLPAFTVVKTDFVYAVASESEINVLQVGANAKVLISALNEELDGKIAIINPQADNYSKTYLVKVRLDNTNGQLLPGMIANISISTGKSQDQIIIPIQSVVRGLDGLNYVFITKSDNTAFRKRVIISHVTGINDVVVANGLSAGDKLIVEGQTKLDDGDLIKF